MRLAGWVLSRWLGVFAQAFVSLGMVRGAWFGVRRNAGATSCVSRFPILLMDAFGPTPETSVANAGGIA